MALPYSVCLFEGVISGAGSDHALWTVPAGFVDVMRDIDGFQTSGSAGIASVRTPAGYFLILGSVATSTAVEWRGRQVFTAGTTVSLNPNVSPWTLRICGYRLVAA